MAAFLIPLAMGVAGAAASAYGGRKAKKGARREASAYGKLAEQAEQQRRAAAQTSGQSRNQFMEAATGARDFDPTEAMNRTAGSMMTSIGDQYRQTTNARMGNLNARGLFGSNIGGARAERNLNSQIAQALAGLSMQGAQMKQGALSDYTRNMGHVYGTDRDQENMYWDAAMGLRGSQIAGRAAGDQATAGMWGDIGGSLLGAAGQYAARRW